MWTFFIVNSPKKLHKDSLPLQNSAIPVIILRQRVYHREYKKLIFNFTSEISDIFYNLLNLKLSFQKFYKNSKISEELLYEISAHCQYMCCSANDDNSAYLHFTSRTLRER